MNLQQATTLSNLKTPAPVQVKSIKASARQVAKFVLDRCERNGYAYKYHTPKSWANKYLDSKEFVLMEIGINAAASPHTPRDPKRVAHYLKCSAGSDIDDPIVVDTNKRKEGRTLLGFVPEIIVQDGKHRKAAKLAQGHKTIMAWVGIKASKKMKKNPIPEVDESEIILPKVEHTKIAAAYEIHASTVPAAKVIKKVKANGKELCSCGARSSGQIESDDLDPSDGGVPPSASDSGSRTDSSDQLRWNPDKPQMKTPGASGKESFEFGLNQAAAYGSNIGPRVKNTGASKSDMSRTLNAGGPGSGRHKMLTDLAEKVGKEWSSTRGLDFTKPEAHTQYEQSKDRIRQHLSDAGVQPKELANHITKMSTAVGRRTNVNWLKNLEAGKMKACKACGQFHTVGKCKMAAGKVGKIWTKKNKMQAVAPPGREQQVLKLKEKFGEDSSVPFKIAWSQKNGRGKR
jgi:hypothetical protein